MGDVLSCNLRNVLMWVHLYDVIRSDMGFDYDSDYYSSTILNTLLSGINVNDVEAELARLISGRDVGVVGASSSCLHELKTMGRVPNVLIAADGALRCCIEAGYIPNVVVTDLDGLCEGDLGYVDTIYVIHAHGNNVDRLVKYVNLVRGAVIGTTQCMPQGSLRIYGGFTDGDRAAYLAYFFNAKSIKLIGFDLESGFVGRYSKPWLNSDYYASGSKLRKFKWARRLINILRVCSDVVLEAE